MPKITAISSAILAWLFLMVITVYPVIAIDDTDTSNTGGLTQEAQSRIKPIQPLKRDTATDTAAKRESLKRNLETAKQNVSERLSALKEKMASREAALKAKLEAFKDRKKAEIADRININLNRINQNQTDQMIKHLERMSNILDKLEARVNQSRPDIKDPAAARQAIGKARSAVASASALASAQTEKDYTLQIFSENRVRRDAKNQRDALHSDLKALREAVREAKKAVADAIRVAKSGVKVKEGTSSGQQ